MGPKRSEPTCRRAGCKANHSNGAGFSTMTPRGHSRNFASCPAPVLRALCARRSLLGHSAHAAVLAGHSVLFTTAAQSLLDLGAQESARTLNKRLRHRPRGAPS
jgi:hypothetical protein